MRHGIRRRYRFMHIETVPPVDILSAFCVAHTEFTASGRTVETPYRSTTVWCSAMSSAPSMSVRLVEWVDGPN
jgi:hypothetical protein